jgi:hypothetical protein
VWIPSLITIGQTTLFSASSFMEFTACKSDIAGPGLLQDTKIKEELMIGLS